MSDPSSLRALGAALAASAILWLFPGAARAQCPSNASSCVSCHEAQGLRPVLAQAQPWHRDHAFGDLCGACHGGHPMEATALLAHAGLTRPLDDVRGTCGSCHQADAEARAAPYAAAREAAAPPAPNEPPPSGPTPIATPTAPELRRSSRLDLALAVTAGALGIGIAFLVRARRKSPGEVVQALRRERWSPYAAGAGLGAVIAISLVAFGQPVAVAGGFDRLAAYLGRALFPGAPYYRHVMAPAITWQVFTLVGILIGAFASARLAGTMRARVMPDRQWQQAFGPRLWVRWLLAFFGAMLVQFGAGVAGGCTSGLAMSAGALLAPAAFLFMAGMFAGGIPTARLAYWNRRRR